MTIVFGTTLGPGSAPFADAAALFASRMGEPLRLLHASEDPRAPFVLGTDEERVLGSVRADLTREARRLASLTGAEVEPHLAAGPVVDALVSVAGWDLATAVLLGAGSKPSYNPLGGVSERVSRRCRSPVLALRDPERLSSWLRGQSTLRILVGADLGQAADAARAFASRLARLSAAEIHVVLVASPAEQHARLGLPAPSDPHALSAEAEAILLRELSRSATPGERSATLRVVPGRGLADAHLVALADREGFDMVIVGQRRRSAVEQLWYGSVASGVLRAAPVSVTCVPATSDEAPTAVHAPRVVLAATDFTEVGDRAARHAAACAAEGATVHVAHVLTLPETTTTLLADREQAWHRLLKLPGGDPAERAVSLERHVLEGDPARQLLALSTRVGADLVVLGARSRTAIGRALLGSVAQAVVEGSRVPVLLVPLPPT